MIFGDNYQKFLMFQSNDIWRYSNIFDDIRRWKRTHLKQENCRPKNIVKYPHLVSSEKRGLKQNTMNS